MSRRKLTRDQEKAMFAKFAHPQPVTKKNIQNKMKQRSKRARSMDRRITAKHTYDLRNQKNKKKWMKHPNQYDLQGIDTAIAKERYHARVSKKLLKEKRIHVHKIKKQLHKKREQIKRVKKPEEKQRLHLEIKKKELEHKKAEIDVRNVEVKHRKLKRSIHEKQEESEEVKYIMHATQNNNYMESKALLERAKNKGLVYDQVDWDQMQGPDLVYEDRVRRLDNLIGKTYTDEELYHGHQEEMYKEKEQEWLSHQGLHA